MWSLKINVPCLHQNILNDFTQPSKQRWRELRRSVWKCQSCARSASYHNYQSFFCLLLCHRCNITALTIFVATAAHECVALILEVVHNAVLPADTGSDLYTYVELTSSINQAKFIIHKELSLCEKKQVRWRQKTITMRSGVVNFTNLVHNSHGVSVLSCLYHGHLPRLCSGLFIVSLTHE